MQADEDPIIKELTNDLSFLRYMPIAIAAFKASGIERILRQRGRPLTVPATQDNCVAAQAFEAQRSIGYNTALDDLLYFKERFLMNRDDNTHKPPKMLYGAGQTALYTGDLSKEELDAIINGTDPADIYRAHLDAVKPADIQRPKFDGNAAPAIDALGAGTAS